jgi:hypothetical protein
MAEDPNFFVEVLCQVFRPNHRDADVESEPSLEAKARARIGYSLLESMDRIPGQIGDTQFDEGALLEWVNAVRKKASELDRAEIADQKIGEVLAHSPLDPDDGGWPHSIIRNVLEGLASENIDLGLKVKRHNMRGVYAKSLDEGGAQERALAREYRDWADVSRNRWPRVARVLERIAKGWEEVGRSEDVDAAQRELY